MTYGKNDQDQNKQDEQDDDEQSSLMDQDDSQKSQSKPSQPTKQQQQQQQEEVNSMSTFKEFLSKVFQNEEVRSLADARLAIEEEFEHNFMAERDHLDYLKQKQDNNKIKTFQSPMRQKKLATIKQMQERDMHIANSNSQVKGTQGQGTNIYNSRRQSNVSMKDESQEQNQFNEDQEMLDFNHHSDPDEDYDNEGSINETLTGIRNQIPQSKIKQPQKPNDREETKNEFELQQPKSDKHKRKSYFDRCKEVGRIGPATTKLDPESGGAQSIKLFGTDALEVEALSQFASIRANTAVFSGKYYYEVKLLTGGLMQIGWCTLATPFMIENGVGDDETSYAYDGNRQKKWNASNQVYGECWSAGDIIGTLIDFDRREITFWRNDKCLGVAFKNIKVGPNMAYFPAISMSSGEKVLFNFGRRPFRIRSNYTSCAINEPECFVNNYYSTAMYIVETIKRYVVTYYEFPTLSEDERLMIGSILFEYLIPLMNDQYIMEDLIVQFFFELVMIPKPELYELIVKTIEIHMSTEQLIEWTSLFMTILSRKINEIQLARAEKETNKEFDLNYMKIVIQLMQRDSFMYAWLCSDNFYEDLESLYMLHLPSQTDWDILIPKHYHELLIGSQENKEHYYDSQRHVLKNLRITQKYWFQITDLLMDKRPRCPPDSQAPKVPFDLYMEFLHYLVYKNNGYVKNVKPPGLTPQTTLANVFFSASRYLDDIVYSQSFDKFPFHCFFMREANGLMDENLKVFERVGGTFSHLENELNQNLRQFSGKPISSQQKQNFIFARNLILIFTYGVLSDVQSYVKCLEKIYVNSRYVEDFTQRGREEFSKHLIDEMAQSVKRLVQYQLIFQSESNRVQIHKFSLWLIRLMNYVDENFQDIVYIMPENFVETPFEVFRAFKRGGNTLYETEVEQTQTFKEEYEYVYNTQELRQTSFAQELVKYISKHFYDSKIANPDQKETYLTRLNILLQYERYIKLFEQYEYSQENLLPLLMKSFDKRQIFAVTKNFLRFSKGKGFKEIVYQNLVENTSSEFFLGKLRKQLLMENDKTSKDFMNALFNSLNELTTELFVVFKELKNNFSMTVVKRTKTLFQMVIDLCRLLEVITKWVPEIFVDKDQIHSSRLLNYIMFVLNSFFCGGIDGYIEFFSQKTLQRSDTFPQFLAPILSILKNIYDAVNNLGIKDNIKYDNLADIFQKTDSFDSILFEKLKQIVKNELPAQDMNEKQVFDTFEQMLDEIEMLCKCNKIRKHSLQSMGSDKGGQDGLMEGGNEQEQINEELLCNICYFNEKNTAFDPCGHSTCQKCIQVHMLNSERCPFCNVVIKEIKKIQ